MAQRYSIPWEKIYDYVMECGLVHEPYQFVVTALEGARDLVPYDQGIVYCLDESRRVQAQHLVNIKSRWSTMYLKYYSQLDSTRHKLDMRADEVYGVPTLEHIDWEHENMNEFLANYIMARGVKYSLGFALFDLNGLPRAAFSLDRTRDERFNELEMATMRFALAQLGNLYKNFFADAGDAFGRKKHEVDQMMMDLLTKREREVVDLMLQGLSPAHVAKTLRITTSTAYKHISHIYKKLGVSSQQELFVRILR